MFILVLIEKIAIHLSYLQAKVLITECAERKLL